MNQLTGVAVSIVALATIAFIGVGIIEMTNDSVSAVAPNSTILTEFYGNIQTTFSTLGNMLPIVVLALVGGLAIFYVISYLGSRAE